MTFPGGLIPRRDPTRQEPGNSTAVTFGEGFDEAQGRFLTTEEAATARLMGFYKQARLEIIDFLRGNGEPTPNQTAYFDQLLAETDRVVERLNTGAREFFEETIPAAFIEGARTQNARVGFTALHERAVDALAADTLGLITNTNEGIRRSVQQAVASGILEGLSSEAIRTRMIEGGLQPGPWRTVEERAGVIARTETMRAYNAGNIVAAQESGAPFVEWIASPDEKTCHICGPRDGVRFRTPGFDPSRLGGAAPQDVEPLTNFGEALTPKQYEALLPEPFREGLRAETLEAMATTPEGALLADTFRKFQSMDTTGIENLRAAITNRITGVPQDADADARADVMLGAIRSFPTDQVPPELHRGVVSTASVEELLSRYEVGKEIDLNVTSFSSEPLVANMFAGLPTEGYGEGRNLEPGERPITIRLVGQKAALPMQNLSRADWIHLEQEWLTTGRFVVESVSHRQRKVGSNGRLIEVDHIEVTIRQEAAL
jgi:hypothetical protein